MHKFGTVSSTVGREECILSELRKWEADLAVTSLGTEQRIVKQHVCSNTE